MKQFNDQKIIPISEYNFTPALAQQKLRSEGADGIFKTSFRMNLPKYILIRLKELGYTYCRQVGSTTYKSSTWAVWKVRPDGVSNYDNELRLFE